jgi:hypothetical protein
MQTRTDTGEVIGPARLLEMLEWRFGAFEALAYASLTLAQRVDLDFCPPMDKATATAVLEFRNDLKQAFDETSKWAEVHFGGRGVRPHTPEQ